MIFGVWREVAKCLILLVGELGFEPRQAESESAVLPLDDSPFTSATQSGPMSLALNAFRPLEPNLQARSGQFLEPLVPPVDRRDQRAYGNRRAHSPRVAASLTPRARARHHDIHAASRWNNALTETFNTL